MKRISIVLILLLSIGSGCSSKNGPPEVGIIDEHGLQELVAQHQGKVLVLNLWATWCAPCVEEFPDLVRLHEQYQSEGAQLVGISIDALSRMDKVKAFLKEQQANFPIYIKNTKDDEAFIRAVHPEWEGALPTTFVYNREGEVANVLLGAQTLETLTQTIRPLLDSPS